MCLRGSERPDSPATGVLVAMALSALCWLAVWGALR
jgi:hypothetical protein